MSHYLAEKKKIIFLNKPLICYPLISIMTSILTFVVKGGVHWSVPCLQNCDDFSRLNSALVIKILCTILQTSTPKLVRLNFTIQRCFPLEVPQPREHCGEGRLDPD